MQFLNLYIFSLIIGGFCAWLLMKYGVRFGINDIPNHRSSHLKETSKGGGIGVLIVLIMTSMILSISIGFWLPSLIIAIVSFWGGDQRRFSPETRLFMHFTCSLFFLIFLGFSKTISLNYILLCVPLSIFIVGTSNFYNFMDGIDGMAGITGVAGFLLLAIYSYNAGINEPYGVLCIALGFACIGFLFFNIPRARVFLGDIGSILLGFVFACLIIILSDNVTDFIVMTGFFLPFYFDEIFTMVKRIHNGDSLTKAHRKHIYQLLANELSVTHWKIALSYGVIQLFIGFTAIYTSSKGLLCLFLLYIMYCCIFVYIAIEINKKVVVK